MESKHIILSSILNIKYTQRNTQNICPPEISQQLLKSLALKKFPYTAAHFVHFPYLEPSLT